MYTVLTFMDEAPKEEIIGALEVQQQAIQTIYDEMKAGQKEKEKYSEVSKNVLLIFENMYEQCEVQLQFLQKLKQDLLSDHL